MSKRALVIVDLQNEYTDKGNLPLSGIDQAVTNAARLIDAARQRGDMVVHVRHEFPAHELPIFVPGTANVEIIPAVSPAGGEAVILKNHPNPFRDTGLKQMLDDAGVDELLVAGAMSHMCIDATVRAAADLGYRVTVAHDACATLDLEFGGTTVPAAQVHAAVMSALAFGYGTVAATDDLTG